MSLTSFLTESPELREKLRTSLNRPSFGLKADLVAPPLTKNYSIVGQAFDYLLRFQLEQKHQNLISNNKEWVANIAYDRIYQYCRQSKGKRIEIGRAKEYTIEKEKLLFALEFFMDQSKSQHRTFVRKGKLTNKLLESCLFLARLDVTVRAGFIDPTLFESNTNDITDLRALYNAINHDQLYPKKRIVLNPHFGSGSWLVGGADADLIIDGTLIDIKTTKNLTLEREFLNQLIGYYLLSRIGGILSSKKAKPVDSLGIYYSRFGILYKFPASDLGTEEQIKECEKWFYNHADQLIWGGKFEETVLGKKGGKSVK